MRKPSLPFVAVITAATIVIGYLFLEVRAERNAAAQLREHVAQLEGTVQPAGSAALTARLADQVSPSVAPAGNEAPPTVPMPDANRSPTPTRALLKWML